MNLCNETIDKLISNSFEIDCSDICLTQKTDKDPLIYTGPGTIYQDEHGILQLKSFSKTNSHIKEIQSLLKYYQPGKFIPNDDYYTLKAIDLSGNEWFADSIRLSISGSIPASRLVIKSKLRDIETIKQIGTPSSTEKNYLLVIVPGQCDIPCNEQEELPSSGYRLNKAVFSVNDIDLKFRKLDNYLTITANAKPEKSENDTYRKLIEVLSIYTGLVIQPLVIKNTQKNTDTIKIMSMDNSFINEKLPLPINHSTPADFESFTCFIGKYLSNIESPFSDLFGFWHKVNRAWQAGIENASLSLGVAIEGVVKTYFRKQGLPDGEIMQQAKDAKQILEDMGLGNRIKDRLLGSVDGLLNNISPKGALIKLAQDGLLDETMPREWDKLRNKSAHPDETNQDPSAMQKNIDRLYTCIALFYLLLFNIIKYEGSYTDFSKSGWPENRYILINE